MLKYTPFHEKHLAAGGRMVDFAGYSLPVQFRGIIPEHQRVRTTVGVFDVSHMGRIEVRGPGSLAYINRMTTNDASQLAVNQAQYSVLCYEDGGIVDDLVVYRRADHYLLVVNGANNAKDTEWLQSHLPSNVKLDNVTAGVAQLAIQGPKAEAVLQKLTPTPLAAIGFYWAVDCRLAEFDAFLSRTGYTGEDGFEAYFDARHAAAVWDAIFAAGRDFDIEPIGLGARDTLRLEMKMALYGNDIDRTTNPIEAGLSWVVKLAKPGGFIGADALKKVEEAGPERRLVCLEMQDHSIPRPHYLVYDGDTEVGAVTSGTLSPSLRKGIALAYVQRSRVKAGTELAVDIRGTRAPARIVKPPFYKHGTRK